MLRIGDDRIFGLLVFGSYLVSSGRHKFQLQVGSFSLYSTVPNCLGGTFTPPTKFKHRPDIASALTTRNRLSQTATSSSMLETHHIRNEA